MTPPNDSPSSRPRALALLVSIATLLAGCKTVSDPVAINCPPPPPIPLSLSQKASGSMLEQLRLLYQDFLEPAQSPETSSETRSTP